MQRCRGAEVQRCGECGAEAAVTCSANEVIKEALWRSLVFKPEESAIWPGVTTVPQALATGLWAPREQPRASQTCWRPKRIGGMVSSTRWRSPSAERGERTAPETAAPKTAAMRTRVRNLTRSALAGVACFGTAFATLPVVAFTAFFLVVRSALGFSATTVSLAAVSASTSAAIAAASAAEVLVVLRNFFGTGKVPNFLWRAKTLWSCDRKDGNYEAE